MSDDRRKTIVLTEQDGETYLEYEPTVEQIINPTPTPGIEELVTFLDRNAENRNNHGFAHTHRALAALLHQRLGRDVTLAVLREIAAYGGLDALSGKHWSEGDYDAFDVFGDKPW